MLKEGILNSSLIKILAETGHTDFLVFCDKGFPIPKEPERLDLSLIDDIPKITDVVEAVSKQFVIDRIYISNEMKDISEDYHDYLMKKFPMYKFEYVSHIELKEMSNEARAVIRTGDTTPYSNMIVVSG